MRDYIILNGVNSNTITGLLISKLPPITKPKQRTQIEEIDGRDGDIVTTLGYSAYDKEIEIGLYGDFDIDDVIAYFNSEGTVTFSNEPDKFYNYQILDQIDYEKLIRFKKAKIKMHVQPFKYPLEETPVEITVSTVNNEAEEMDLDNTKEAPMQIALKGNTSQEGTPTPDAPVDVSVVSGDNEIKVEGVNIWDEVIENGYINYQTGQNVASDSYRRSKNYIKVNPSTTYYLYMGEAPAGAWIGTIQYDKDKNFLEYKAWAKGTTLTTRNDCEYIRFYLNATSYDKICINKNDSSINGNYYEYIGATYPISLAGKNIFNPQAFITAMDTNYQETKTIDGEEYICLGRRQSTATTYTYPVKCLENTQYTISFKYTSSYCTTAINYSDGTHSDNITPYIATATEVSFTSTENKTITGITIYCGGWYESGSKLQISKPQLERGTTATDYTAFNTNPIEVCKIGDYQDRIYKDSGKWYIEKQIGKVTLDGSESWNINTAWNYTNTNLFILTNTDVHTARQVLSNHFFYYSSAYANDINGEVGQVWTNTLAFRISNTLASDVAGFKTWLGTHNTIVYYILETPTTTEITDETLIAQLEALKNASSYDTKTHITQNANDKPFILNATALQQGSGEATVNNEGNIYSKPTLDIEGSGTIGIYLDGNQMFSVDLSNANECIIDTAKLEAYNPSTSELMNRQVTGDYSNFKLNAGENQVSTTGEITKVTISNYTRWL